MEDMSSPETPVRMGCKSMLLNASKSSASCMLASSIDSMSESLSSSSCATALFFMRDSRKTMRQVACSAASSRCSPTMRCPPFSRMKRVGTFAASAVWLFPRSPSKTMPAEPNSVDGEFPALNASKPFSLTEKVKLLGVPLSCSTFFSAGTGELQVPTRASAAIRSFLFMSKFHFVRPEAFDAFLRKVLVGKETQRASSPLPSLRSACSTPTLLNFFFDFVFLTVKRYITPPSRPWKGAMLLGRSSADLARSKS
mmetsp:Transcript_26923/g.78074  ORF Transcript_26923/g.78074 Transcript_26923/m.78074 type:complete len:254 (+) Transcript_26923:602-1363(+)